MIDQKTRFSSFTPLMYEWEYKLIEKYLTKGDILLEWGSGGSTLYFSDFVSKVISIEHDKDYFKIIKTCVDTYKPQNVELYYVPPSNYDQTKKRYIQLKDYIEYPTVNKFAFTKVLIDGRARKECALHIADTISSDVIVFIHDFNSNSVEGYVDNNYHSDILSRYKVLELEKRGQGIVALQKI